jgi:O-antigen/teichoic acid export membrane protein
VAITAIFGVIANGRYELAIVLPEKDEDAVNITALSILIALLVSVFLLINVLLFNDLIVDLIGNEEIGAWLYFVPLVVLFIGIFNALNYLNTRMKRFGVIAQVKVIKLLSLSVVQVGLGFLKAGALGLISGQIISHVFSNLRLTKVLLENRKLFANVNKENIVEQLIRYRKFLKFSVWATLSNTLSHQLTRIFISSLYSTSVLGYYALVQRILGMPITVISNSIGQVFFQDANSELKKSGNAHRAYKLTFIKLFVLGVFFFGVLFFVVEQLIAFVFGQDWLVAGTYAKYLIPLMFVRFVVSPLTLINIIYEKQNIDLIWQILLLFLSVSVFLTSKVFNLDITHFLILYSLVISIHYLIMAVISYKVSKIQIS